MTASAQHDVSRETPDMFDNGSYFLQAWKEGVELVGPHLFSCRARTPQDAVHWRELVPDLDKMRKALPNKSKGEACLMACMASLFNDEEGQKLLNKAGATFGSLPMAMGERSRHIVAKLLLTYRGW